MLLQQSLLALPAGRIPKFKASRKESIPNIVCGPHELIMLSAQSGDEKLSGFLPSSFSADCTKQSCFAIPNGGSICFLHSNNSEHKIGELASDSS